MPLSSGENRLYIEAGLLNGVSYSYSLFINGKLINSRKMELIK